MTREMTPRQKAMFGRWQKAMEDGPYTEHYHDPTGTETHGVTTSAERWPILQEVIVELNSNKTHVVKINVITGRVSDTYPGDPGDHKRRGKHQ